MAPEQPLVFTEHTNHHQAKRLHYNLRKLSEMPYHLVQARRITDLKQLVFFNYEWLSTKLQAMSLHDIISDFRFALDSGFDEKPLMLLANTLRISGGHLKDTPNALAFELTGRLLPYYDRFREVKSLLQQCDTVALKDTCLVPLFQCFEAPRGMLTYILEDHNEIVLDLIFSKSNHELISISRDNTIAFWDMRTGDRTRMIDVSYQQSGPNTRLYQSDDGRYLVSDSDAINSPAYIFDMKSGQLVHKVGKRLTTQRRCFVVGHLMLRQRSIIDIKAGKEVGSIDDFKSAKKFLTCGITPNQKYILLGDNTETSMFDLRTRKHLMSFSGKHMPCQFVFTSDSAFCYTGYNEDCLFKIFNIDTNSKHFGKTMLVYNYLEAFPELANMDAPIYANELSSIAFSPREESKVLISIKRCQLILLDVKDRNSYKVDMTPVRQGPEKAFVTHARISSDAKFIIAAAGTYMHIWCAQKFTYIYGVNIHSIERFPISVSTSQNLIATGSTLHTAIKTWDLDKIYTTQDTGLKIYTNPIDTLACGHAQRLLFVKTYHRLNYKYIDYFGLDVWNISTGHVATCLATGKYGELVRMRVSRDGHQMALLLSTRDQSYVCALSLKLGKVLAFHRHPGCVEFVLSHNCEFLATEAMVEGQGPEVKLWCFKGGELARFADASSPVFTSDDAFLLYVESRQSIEVFSLKKMEGVNSMLCQVHSLSRVPTLNLYILATVYQYSEDGHSRVGHSEVSLWHITGGCMISQFTNAAPSGMKDFSKDGRICIDGFLQVFDIKSGKLMTRLKSGKMSSDELSMVRLTHDGQYAIWTHDLSLNVARVNDNTLIGRICTHEKPVSLATLDFGYIVVVGREDGHILTAKLVDGHDNLPPRFEPVSAKERLNTFIEKVIYPDGIIATFDPSCQIKPKAINDSALPKFSKDVQHALQEKAKVPHAVIKTVKKTSSFGDLSEFDKDFKKRRGSSPGISMVDLNTLLGNGHKTAPCRLKKSAKSPSLTNLFAHNTISGRRKSRENSPSAQDIFASPKHTYHHSNPIFNALSGGVCKIFKRKSGGDTSSVTSSPMPARKLAHSPYSLQEENLAGPKHTHLSPSRTSPKLLFTQTSSLASAQDMRRCKSQDRVLIRSAQSPVRIQAKSSPKSGVKNSANIKNSANNYTGSSPNLSSKPPKTPQRVMCKNPMHTSASFDDVITSNSGAADRKLTSSCHENMTSSVNTTAGDPQVRRFYSTSEAPPEITINTEPDVEITKL